MAYTKGPWETVQKAEGKWLVMSKEYPERLPLVVLDTSRDGHEGYGTIETPANAHLIAAAPEMLKALKACHERMERDGYHCASIQMAEEAIAKAEGRS